MEVLRWALVTRRSALLPFPIDLQRRDWGEQCRYFRRPDLNNDWVTWRAPGMFSLKPFELMEFLLGGVGVPYRFPAREDGEAYFEKEPSERESTHSDVETAGRSRARS